jgi:hypothetical protein
MTQMSRVALQPPMQAPRRGLLERVGRDAVAAGAQGLAFLVFIGQLAAVAWGAARHPARLRARLVGREIAIGVAILVGVGLMVSVANSGTKENIQIDRK